MDGQRIASVLGAGFVGLVVGLTGLPYAVVDPAAIGVYFAAGPGGPLLVALFAVIAGIALLAGARGRSDPVVAAGVAVTFGGFGAVVALGWAVSVDPGLVGGLGQVDLLEYHRWALVLAAAGVAAASGWYARLVV